MKNERLTEQENFEYLVMLIRDTQEQYRICSGDVAGLREALPYDPSVRYSDLERESRMLVDLEERLAGYKQQLVDLVLRNETHVAFVRRRGLLIHMLSV